MKKTFGRLGPNQAAFTAWRWLNDRGISYAPSSAKGPAGLMFGHWVIPKWQNLSESQRDRLHGTLRISRNGPAEILIYPEFEGYFPLKVITLWQPWASLVAMGLKQHETRGFGINYRGRLAIHAAQRKPSRAVKDHYQRFADLNGLNLPQIGDLPFGKVLCVGDLARCQKMSAFSSLSQSSLELMAGDWRPGRFAWGLEDVVALPNPVPHIGQQNLHRLSPQCEVEVKTQLLDVTRSLNASTSS